MVKQSPSIIPKPTLKQGMISSGLDSFKSTIPSFGRVKPQTQSAQEYSDSVVKKTGDPLLDAIRFISGGEPLGTSIVANAKNNIVNFNRGNIVPQTQNLDSLISNISTNTFNNATNVINTTANQTAGKESADKISNFNFISEVVKYFGSKNDTNQTVGGQGVDKKFNLKFISEFIKFFGSKNTEKTIKKNLKLLRTSLVDTFEIAILLRKAIKKIAKELSDLSLGGFGGGGGGLLGGLLGGLGSLLGLSGLLGGKKGRTPTRMPTNTGMPRLGKLGKLGLGLGALGLGAGITSALDQPEAPSAEPAFSSSQEILNKFNSVIDRFDKAIESLMKGKQRGGGKQPSAPPPSAPAAIGGSIAPGTANMNTADLGKVTEAVKDPNVKAFLDTIANVESGGKYNVRYGGETFSDMSKHPEIGRGIPGTNLSSDAAGRYQFLSTTYKPIAQRLGLKDFSPQSQDLAAAQYLQDLGVLDEIQSGDPKKIQSAIDRLKGSKWTGLQKYGIDQGVKFFEERKRMYSGQVQPSKTKPQVDPTKPARTKADLIGTPSPAETPRLVRPPAAAPKKGPEVSILPFNSPQPQVQAAPQSPKIMNPSGSGNNGPSLAFLPANNADSYSGLYAKMVYNIV